MIAIEIKENKEDMEEKKLNLKPFDIQKAREGKPVCTRDGKRRGLFALIREAFTLLLPLFRRKEVKRAIFMRKTESAQIVEMDMTF